MACHVCGNCVLELRGNRCRKCYVRGRGFDHEPLMVECANDDCWSLLAYHNVDDHEIACRYGPCSCTEADCGFTALPAELIAHLAVAHKIQAHRFQYGVPILYVEQSVPAPGSPRRQIIGYGDDGTVFAIFIVAVGTATFVSSVCVRSAACLWPRYKVKMWATGPQSSTAASLEELSTDKVKAVMELTSSALPGNVALEELMSFLAVPPWYLTGYEPFNNVNFMVRIDKK